MDAQTTQSDNSDGNGWHEGELELQRTAGVNSSSMRRAIARVMPKVAQEFLGQQHLAALATVDVNGAPWASVLQGPRGFLLAVNTKTVRIARQALGTQAHLNLAGLATSEKSLNSASSQVGLIAIEPATRRRMRINGKARFHGNGDLLIEAEEVFSNCPKYIQTRTPATALNKFADEGQRSQRSELNAADQALVGHADAFFIASRHKQAGADASHRGGRPGFVRTLSPTHLSFPDYSGNRMFQTLGNLAVDERAGLVFPDFTNGSILQLSGSARFTDAPERTPEFPGAQRVVDFQVSEVLYTTYENFTPWNFGEYSPALPN